VKMQPRSRINQLRCEGTTATAVEQHH
jgi:hypothetical protein